MGIGGYTGTGPTEQGALYSNTTGGYNTAVGVAALKANTTASNNTAVGYQAGYSLTTGGLNALFGYQAGYSAVTGANHVFIGRAAGYACTATVANTFVGDGTGGSVTTGKGNMFIGSNNDLAGPCGNAVTTGSYNTIIGSYTGNQGGLDIRTANNYIVLSDGAGNPRLYSDGSGKWIFGASTSNFNSSYIFLNNASTGNWAQTITDSYSGGQSFMSFNYGSTQIGKITGNNSATTYSTSSDYRLKENILPMTGALDKVAQLKPVTYDWKAGGSSQGFIAHELAEVCPDAVVGEKDAVNEDGTIKPQGIDTSFLVATLTAAIQEQQALITDLTARLTALEAK